jgi:hypothetical protein
VLFCSAPVSVWAQSEFSIVENSGSVVARWSRTPAELAGFDASTQVTVYGDGRVVVSFPEPSPRKGSYQTRLAPAELEALMGALVSNNAMAFDSRSLAEPPPSSSVVDRVSSVPDAAATDAVAIAGSAAVARVIRHTADADITRFQINLAEYRPAGGTLQKDVKQEVAVPGLQRLADTHPENTALEGLATAERTFIELLDRANLEPVP